MNRFCPACHRTETHNANTLSADRTHCPRDFFQLAEPQIVDPVAEIFAGKFQTESCVLPGQNHTIFKVIDPASGSKAMVSVLRASATDASRLMKFVETWSQIKHTNVLSVTGYGASPDGQYLYVVSEYPHGQALTNALDEKGNIPADVAIQLFLQICDAIQVLNESRLVHGNLMPAHIFQVQDSEQPHHIHVSCDAALTRFLLAPPDAVSELSPLYLGLEFMKGGDTAEAATDVYSLGCLMYGVLTGMPPFSGKTFSELQQAHLSQQPLSLRGAAPDLDIPGLFDKIVLTAMKKERSARQPNASALKRDLLAAAEKSRIYLPTYMNAGYKAQEYTGDTGAYQPEGGPQGASAGAVDGGSGGYSSRDTGSASGIRSGGAGGGMRGGSYDRGSHSDLRGGADDERGGGSGDRRKGDDDLLPPETRSELESKVKDLRSHVFLVTVIAVVCIVGVAAVLLYEGPPEDRAPMWKKLSWTMSMSDGDSALNGKSFDKAKDSYTKALEMAEFIQDGGDRKAKTLRKLLAAHEGLHDKSGAAKIREQLVQFDEQRLKRDEEPVK